MQQNVKLGPGYVRRQKNLTYHIKGVSLHCFGQNGLNSIHIRGCIKARYQKILRVDATSPQVFIKLEDSLVLLFSAARKCNIQKGAEIFLPKFNFGLMIYWVASD